MSAYEHVRTPAEVMHADILKRARFHRLLASLIEGELAEVTRLYTVSIPLGNWPEFNPVPPEYAAEAVRLLRARHWSAKFEVRGIETYLALTPLSEVTE